MELRIEAEESPKPECLATQREPTGRAEATYPRTKVARMTLSRPEIPGRPEDATE